MPRRTKEEAEQTRQDILYSALDIFCEKGYSKTTFDEIAKRINLTKGAVYWHFRNKPDIITALITEAFNRTNNAITEKIPEVNNLADLRTHFKCLAEIVRDVPNYRKFLFFMLFQMEWSESLFLHIGSAVKEIRDFPINIITQALTNSQKSGEISENININETAVCIFSLWQGMLSYAICRKSWVDFPKLFLNGFDLIIKALKDERPDNETR